MLNKLKQVLRVTNIQFFTPDGIYRKL